MNVRNMFRKRKTIYDVRRKVCLKEQALRMRMDIEVELQVMWFFDQDVGFRLLNEGRMD